MPANKIILNREVLLDLSADTIAPNDVKKGVTFHDRYGVEHEGTYEVALQDKKVTPTKEQQVIAPDAEHEGLSEVTVGPIPDEYIVPSGTLPITTNGVHDITQFASIEVAVAGGDIADYDGTVTTTKIGGEV